VRARFTEVLEKRKVVVHTQAEVVQVSPGCLHTRDGRTFDADETMWVTQAGGPAWLQSTGLALDKQGFILVHPQLQTLNDPLVFAAGDIASFVERPLEKAGVFAVRMAKPLADNLRRSLRGQKLLAYNPQRHWLALISTGNRFAVASRGSLGFAGAWVWRWKDRIDREFMRRFTEFPAMPGTGGPAQPGSQVREAVQAMGQLLKDIQAHGKPPTARLTLTAEESLQAISAIAMRCGGCGAKVGANILSRALGSLQPVERPDVLILTKPIGTGTLFAAHARLAVKGRWIDAARQSMVLSNRLGAQCLRKFGATACTDLTGFGLLGHLVEMTRASEVDAELVLSNLPLLDGALETVAAGIVSSLQPANVRLRRALRNQEEFVNDPRYPLLFDPQTAGGLLASVPADRADACVVALKAAGYAQTAVIGRILAQGEALEPVVLLP
jgi:hypothetical protein